MLPFVILYGISDGLALFLQYIIRYRREIILQNLMRSFPEKSQAEIKKITRKYYRNLSDLILETLKLESVSRKSLLKRFTFENLDIIKKSFENGRSVIVSIGHCGNWEWTATALAFLLPQKGYGVVKPLTDPRFNRYMNSLRERFYPSSIIPFRNTFRTMIRHKQEQITFTVIAADQTPTKDEINYWSNFLNQETAFFLGIDKISRALDFDVVFVDIQRLGRGRYKGVIELMTEAPKSTPEFSIMEDYIQRLEAAIRLHPDNWLWSHRRWKHKREQK